MIFEKELAYRYQCYCLNDHMWKIDFRKSFGITFLFLLRTVVSFGQTLPNICLTSNPAPTGYLRGGQTSTSPTIACADYNTGNKTVYFQQTPGAPLTLDDIKFYVGVDQNFDLNAPSVPAENASQLAGIWILQKQMAPGSYSYVMTGTANGQKYYACSQLRVVSTEPPKMLANYCASNAVTITIPVDPLNHFDRYDVDWGNNFVDVINVNTQPLPVTITRNFTGNATPITIKGRTTLGACVSQPYTATPASGSSPFLTELTGENGGTEATLKFTDYDPATTYDIFGMIDDGSASGNFVKLATAQNGTATLTGLSGQNRYCFKTVHTNSCGNTLNSENTLCSIKLQSSMQSPAEVALQWNLPTLPAGIPGILRLHKAVQGCATCQSQPPLPSNSTTSFVDGPVQCSDIYLYTVEARYTQVYNGTSRTITIKSPQSLIDPKANITPIKPTNLVELGYDPNNEDNVKITIAKPAGTTVSRYQLFRAQANSDNFISIGNSAVNTFDDVSITHKNVAYCYKYKQEDQCGTPSDFSPPFCTVLLSSDQPGRLLWTPYEIPPEVISNEINTTYYVEIFNPNIGGDGEFAGAFTTNNTYESVQDVIDMLDEEQVKFRVKAIKTVDTQTNQGIPVESYSNIYTVTVPPRVFAPTAFTPDGSGPAENESFRVITKFVKEGNMTIYDAWGSVIFASNNLDEGWPGTERNSSKPAPTGNYAYKIKGVSTAGNPFTFSGSILLLR